MILLSGHSLTQARRVPLEAMSLSIRERETTATITPADITWIQLKSWLKDDTDPGKGIVYRVRDIDQNYNTATYQVSLEHIINTLKDKILFGEHKTETIAGVKGAKTVTARKAAQYVLAKQTDWVLGEFDYTDSNPYKFDGETLFDAIEKVTDSLEDSIWTYDLTAYPFKLNIKRASSTVGTELRAGRNLRTLRKKISKTGMFTRHYPIGKDDLHLPGGGYVEKNRESYGLVSKVETDQSLDTVEELRRWSNEQLAKHAEPTVEIDVEGVELADATGVSLDSVEICRKCRIPLPDFGTTILERITGIDYPEKIRQPKVFRATLANTKKDVTKVIADFMKRSGGGGRAAAREQKEKTAWILDTDNRVGLCAKGIVGVDEDGNPNWVRLTNLIVDENGLDSSVQAVKDGLVTAETRIKQTEHAIELEAKRASKEEGNLRASIKVQADKIELKVSKDDIISSINQTPESISINAARINLTGYTTMTQFNALSGTVDGILAAGTFGANKITSTQINATGTLAASSTFNYKGHTIGTYACQTTGGATFYALGYT